MNIKLDLLLHKRILIECGQLFTDSQYKHAAREAMVQVEIALKEKSGVKEKYGVNLIANLFGEGKGIKLRVPFGDDLQKDAEKLFKGAFAYYRNYCAHDGSRVDKKTALRILIIASELLDLIGASRLSFTKIGGMSGLVKYGEFENPDRVFDLLLALNEFSLPDDDPDWLFDHLLKNGFTERQLQAVMDLGLLVYVSDDFIPPSDIDKSTYLFPETIGWFALTELGKRELENR